MRNEMEMYQIMVPTHKDVGFIFSSVKNLELTLLFYERKCDCVCAMNLHSNSVSVEIISQYYPQ